MSSDARQNPPRVNLPTCINARASNFNRVHGDQHNHVHNMIILDASISHWERCQLLRDLYHELTGSTSTAGISPENGVFTMANHFKTGPIDNVAAGLINKIQQLLLNHIDLSDDGRRLQTELETLRQTLTLVTLAVETYEFTPVGRNLANVISPEVEKCCATLQELFNSIDTCRRGLFSTFICDLWRRVWWSGCDGQILLRTKLSAHRILLGGCLKALNS